jgi:tetratricopeptide (TPR) repeat protein
MPGTPAQQYQMMLQRFIGSRQWDRALEVARDWLAQEPDNTEAHLAAGQALVNMKQFAAAQRHIEKVIAARPNMSFAFRLASIASQNLHKANEAEEYIQRAIELSPMDAMNWYQLALMRYRQGALQSAENHARRALALQPDSADTINLIAICQRGNPETQYNQYLKALELDPENAVVHGNIGVYHLGKKDYVRAEACFRRALQLDPTNQVAQRNLFETLRQRDPVYRVMTWPRRLLYGASWLRRDRAMAARVGLLLLWLAAGQAFFWALAGWLLLVLPLVKAYEWMTISDLKSRAGVVGARRGGLFGFHRWPLMARLGLFGALVAAFWGGVYVLWADKVLDLDQIVIVGVTAILGLYASRLFRWVSARQRRAAASRAERKFQKKAAARQAAARVGRPMDGQY